MIRHDIPGSPLLTCTLCNKASELDCWESAELDANGSGEMICPECWDWCKPKWPEEESQPAKQVQGLLFQETT